MELKDKGQWRTFLASAMDSAPTVTPARAIRPVSTDEYRQALQSLAPVITEKQRRMLIGHAQAPGHAITMSELAALVGFPGYSAANLQYGLWPESWLMPWASRVRAFWCTSLPVLMTIQVRLTAELICTPSSSRRCSNWVGLRVSL